MTFEYKRNVEMMYRAQHLSYTSVRKFIIIIIIIIIIVIIIIILSSPLCTVFTNMYLK